MTATVPTVRLGKIGIYNGEQWETYHAFREGDHVRVEDVTRVPMCEDQIKALPTVPSENGSISITDDFDLWFAKMQNARYSRFGAQIVL